MNDKIQLGIILSELTAMRNLIESAEERVIALMAKHSGMTTGEIKSIFKEAKEAVNDGKE